MRLGLDEGFASSYDMSAMDLVHAEFELKAYSCESQLAITPEYEIHNFYPNRLISTKRAWFDCDFAGARKCSSDFCATFLEDCEFHQEFS